MPLSQGLAILKTGILSWLWLVTDPTHTVALLPWSPVKLGKKSLNLGGKYRETQDQPCLLLGDAVSDSIYLNFMVWVCVCVLLVVGFLFAWLVGLVWFGWDCFLFVGFVLGVIFIFFWWLWNKTWPCGYWPPNQCCRSWPVTDPWPSPLGFWGSWQVLPHTAVVFRFLWSFETGSHYVPKAFSKSSSLGFSVPGVGITGRHDYYQLRNDLFAVLPTLLFFNIVFVCGWVAHHYK